MNVLKQSKKSALLTLLQNGVSQHEIARKTRIDRKTIRKYQHEFENVAAADSNSPMATGFLDLAECGPPGILSATSQSEKAILPSSSACARHHDWIACEIAKGRNAMSLYQDLVELFGFERGYNSVKRYVGRLKKREPEQYDRLEFLPGEEAQVDYGEGAFTTHPKTGKRKKPRLFVMTLRYSRKSFRKVVWQSGQEAWAQLCEQAFRYFGGVPQYVVLDNLKEGVLKPDIYEPELNPVFAAMLAHYGVVADTCRVADPDRKGTVENAVQHTQGTALRGREFASVEAQNEWLMHWEERWASSRIHGRTKRQVIEMFAEEKPYLKPLPLSGFRYFEQGVRTVWDDGLIEVRGVYYAARPAAIYSKVVVRIYATEIEILNPQTLELYRRHLLHSRRGAVLMDEGDRIFNPSRQTQFFLDQAEKIGPQTRRLCESLFKEQGRVGQRRMRGIVGLAKRHTAKAIEEASCIAINCHITSSGSVRRLVERIERNSGETQQQELPLLTQSHELIRDPSDYARFFEEHAKNIFDEIKTQPTQEKYHADVDC